MKNEVNVFALFDLWDCLVFVSISIIFGQPSVPIAVGKTLDKIS